MVGVFPTIDLRRDPEILGEALKSVGEGIGNILGAIKEKKEAKKVAQLLQQIIGQQLSKIEGEEKERKAKVGEVVKVLEQSLTPKEIQKEEDKKPTTETVKEEDKKPAAETKWEKSYSGEPPSEVMKKLFEPLKWKQTRVGEPLSEETKKLLGISTEAKNIQNLVNSEIKRLSEGKPNLIQIFSILNSMPERNYTTSLLTIFNEALKDPLMSKNPQLVLSYLQPVMSILATGLERTAKEKQDLISNLLSAYKLQKDVEFAERELDIKKLLSDIKRITERGKLEIGFEKLGLGEEKLGLEKEKLGMEALGRAMKERDQLLKQFFSGLPLALKREMNEGRLPNLPEIVTFIQDYLTRALNAATALTTSTPTSASAPAPAPTPTQPTTDLTKDVLDLLSNPSEWRKVKDTSIDQIIKDIKK